MSLLVAMLAIFLLLRLLPGDPANALLSVQATPEQIAAAQAQVGSNVPLLEQLVAWFRGMLTLDLGHSFISTLPVAPGDRRPAVRDGPADPARVRSGVRAVAGGRLRRGLQGGPLVRRRALRVLAAVRRDPGVLGRHPARQRLRAAVSVLPAGGFPREGWSEPGDALTHLALPVLTVALVMAASLSRYVRSATLDVMGSDYLRNARAMGSTFGMALLRHGLRNGAVPVISILGIELATTFLGAVVVESVFALPGLGSMLLKAISQHDYPNIQGILFVSTLAVLLIGFVADVAQRLVDPRLRQRTGSP